jgi:4a-hydroxytetrahydrobiopterin dehydratase
MDKLSNSEVAESLESLEGWSVTDSRLQKHFDFANFPELISFVVRVGFMAEAANHHPDVLIQYHRLTFMLWTHEVMGLTQKDLDLAKQIQAALNRY